VKRQLPADWQLALRFGLAGLLNTAFGYCAFAIFIFLKFLPFAALTLATILGVAFNFQTSKRLVFRSGGRAARFVLVYAAVLLLNWAALRALQRLGLGPLAAQALLVLPFAVISFLAQKQLVFTGAGEG
jgi:putative flippase GtrA